MMKPQANGTAMPVAEIEKQAAPTRRTSFRSVSMPVRSSSSRMPTCDSASIMLFCAGSAGKIACCASGHTQPNSDGPSRMPPINWPMMAGWPSRSRISPSPRPTTSKSTILATNAASPEPLITAPPCAGSAAWAAPAASRTAAAISGIARLARPTICPDCIRPSSTSIGRGLNAQSRPSVARAVACRA